MITGALQAARIAESARRGIKDLGDKDVWGFYSGRVSLANAQWFSMKRAISYY